MLSLDRAAVLYWSCFEKGGDWLLDFVCFLLSLCVGHLDFNMLNPTLEVSLPLLFLRRKKQKFRREYNTSRFWFFLL